MVLVWLLCDLWLYPAYRYYTHFLKVEVSQSHPVMKAFCGLLLDIMVEGGSAGKKIRDTEEGTHTSNSTVHLTCVLFNSSA